MFSVCVCYTLALCLSELIVNTGLPIEYTHVAHSFPLIENVPMLCFHICVYVRHLVCFKVLLIQLCY